MAKTIGNPISWAAQHIGATGDHIAESVNRIGSADTRHLPKVQTVTMQDLKRLLCGQGTTIFWKHGRMPYSSC